MEVLFAAAGPGIYGYATKADYERRVSYQLADDAPARQAAETALAAWRILGCRDAGRVDLRCDADGVPNFIEVNPLAGLNPVHSDLPIMCRLKGSSFEELVGRVMESACGRLAREEI
jgi:D-alanine-D-alanine ligase